jgi:branched-chain amino acid aminotransferase
VAAAEEPAMAQLIPYDDRDGCIWFNGEMVPWREARVHVLTHGLHYGSCVFEGERAYGGRVFRLREHSQRLIDSGRILGFEVPYTVEEIDAATDAVVAKNGGGDLYVRPVAWRGSEQMGVSAQASRINVAIAAWTWGAYYSDLRLTKALYDRPAPNTAPVHAKAAGLYMICTLSKHAAEAKGFGDALMLDYRGYVAETTGANIFLVKDGEIHTPLPDCFLNGITRQTVIGLARRRGYVVNERHIRPEELRDTQEIFVTGTAAEVTPVRAIDDLHYQLGPVTSQLMDDFRAATRGLDKAA